MQLLVHHTDLNDSANEVKIYDLSSNITTDSLEKLVLADWSSRTAGGRETQRLVRGSAYITENQQTVLHRVTGHETLTDIPEKSSAYSTMCICPTN